LPSRSSNVGLKKPISLDENLLLVVAVLGGPCPPCGPCGPRSIPVRMTFSIELRSSVGGVWSYLVCHIVRVSFDFSYSTDVLVPRVGDLAGLFWCDSVCVGLKRGGMSGRLRNSPGRRLVVWRCGGYAIRVGSAVDTMRSTAALRAGSRVSQ
jgi:hypothetical protein